MTATPYHLTRLLVAVQDYEDADLASEWGSALASALHLPLSLVHVLEETPARGSLHEARVIAEDWLQLLASNPAMQKVSVDSAVLTGNAGEALSRKGLEQRGTMLVFVASADASGSPQAMGGSLDALLSELRLPFIVVPAGSHVPDRIRRIVVGVDQSELAATVLQTARRVAHNLDVDIIAVEAVEFGALPADEFVQFAPVIRPEHVQVRGMASRVLLSTAQARGASLIAVGSHGAGGSRHTITGSTSAWLSKNSDRPVLIVPENRSAVS